MFEKEKKFMIPEIEIIVFSGEDIILTSTTDEMDGPDVDDVTTH